MQSKVNAYLFRLGRASYTRSRLLGWLLLIAFTSLSCLMLFWALQLWPSYQHSWTPFLKWQDALLASLLYTTLTSFSGSILVARFLVLLKIGRREEMLSLENDSTFTTRDLSVENLASIFWSVGTTFVCFVAALVGLIPEMLIGWTLSLGSPLLVFSATAGAVVLSLAGLALTMPALIFTVVGWFGWISFLKKIGSACTYHLSPQTTIMIDGFVLTIIHPDKPEALIDLNLLDLEDQRHLLHLFRKRWLEAQQSWNPGFGDEIEAALKALESPGIRSYVS